MLQRRRRRGATLLTPLRFANAIIETSLPSVLLWTVSQYWSPTVAFGAWPSMLYFIFIVAATLRLDFVPPVFTGAVAAIGYMLVVVLVLPLSTTPDDPVLAPLYHLTKAGIMLVAGVVAGLVSMRLRHTFRRAVDEAAARERVTNLFGQHVSPTVVERLLERPAEFSGEPRAVCVMFLDIRNFTSQARQRRPTEVVEFLNGVFAFMIEAVDRHGGFINKFLGDGFMAVFGVPLDDSRAAQHAVAAARDILAEIGGRGLGDGPWPLRVGIGLHAGPAVIGNVGSPRRKEFTAIGDTVNLASRLEQLNKEFGSPLLVSDAVAAALGQAGGPATPLGNSRSRGMRGRFACGGPRGRLAREVTAMTTARPGPGGRPPGWQQEHARRYRESGGQDGHIWEGVTTLLLTTMGRHSGQSRTTPLIYGRDGGRYLVVASRGGAPKHPDWYENLIAQPAVEVQVMADRFKARARPATAAEKPALWKTMTAIWPAYDEYQARTTREIPLVIIERG